MKNTIDTIVLCFCTIGLGIGMLARYETGSFRPMSGVLMILFICCAGWLFVRAYLDYEPKEDDLIDNEIE